LTSSTDGPERALLQAGRVAGPHGLDGSFYVAEPRPPLLAHGVKVLIRGTWLKVERRAGTDRRPLIRLAGINDRDAARDLAGEPLLVDRSVAPPLDEDEWWVEDLEGCQVSDAGRPVGVVRRVMALPSCEVLEVARAAAGDLLVPLVGDAVRAVDVQRREIDIDLAFLGEA
jgi:16S rRNA processing protein RimM